MATAENAKLQYEAGQNVTAMSALTDSGDKTTFTSAATLWSAKSGYEADVRPDGVITGGAVTPAAAAGNNNVDVAALSCYLAGVKTAVSAGTDKAALRGSTQPYRTTSVTINSSGVITMVGGTEGASVSETRGAAGGPPYIPVGSIEIAQVRLTSTTAAPVTASEIKAVVGVHLERYDYPVFDADPDNGEITFADALPASHTGDLPKGVYASYAEPIFADISLASDFTPPETTHSVSSTQIYGRTIGSSSSSLGQGSFTAYLNDGVSDPLVGLKNENLWFKFYPDRYKAPYLLCQGKFGISRTFGASDQIQAACTISADREATEVSA